MNEIGVDFHESTCSRARHSSAPSPELLEGVLYPTGRPARGRGTRQVKLRELFCVTCTVHKLRRRQVAEPVGILYYDYILIRDITIPYT